MNGVYGIQGSASPLNKPGARAFGAAWSVGGHFWLFGGDGFTASGSDDYLNDLWNYNTTTKEWTWVKGDSVVNASAVYGTQGMPSPSNKPGARSQCGGWNSGNALLLFGGISGGINFYNDLWKFNMEYTLPLHVLTFTTHLSEQRTVNSEQRAIVNLRWTAENEVNFERYEIERSTNGREFSKVGRVRAANNREYSYDDNVGGLSSVAGGRLYYRLKMIDKDGSFTYSKVESVSFNIQHSAFNITPNPVSNTATLTSQSIIRHITISDASGKVVYSADASSNNVVVNVSSLSKGIYTVKALFANGETHVVKMVKSN